jgi:tetratricopeptide (TPR) repeat protein
LSCRGAILFAEGRFNEAKPVQEAALNIARIHVTGDDQKLASSLSVLGAIELACGNVLMASKLVDDGLEMRQRVYPSGHPTIASSFYLKGRILLAMGRFADASAAINESLKFRTESMGTRHPSVAQCLHTLAEIATLGGMPFEAEQRCRAALDIRKEIFVESFPDNRDLTQSIFGLAQNAEGRGDVREAVALYEQALKLRFDFMVRLSLQHHIDVVESAIGLAGIYRVLGRLSDAESLTGLAVSMTTQLFGSNSIKMFDCLFAVGELARIKGKYSDARDSYLRCLSILNHRLVN